MGIRQYLTPNNLKMGGSSIANGVGWGSQAFAITGFIQLPMWFVITVGLATLLVGAKRGKDLMEKRLQKKEDIVKKRQQHKEDIDTLYKDVIRDQSKLQACLKNVKFSIHYKNKIKTLEDRVQLLETETPQQRVERVRKETSNKNRADAQIYAIRQSSIKAPKDLPAPVVEHKDVKIEFKDIKAEEKLQQNNDPTDAKEIKQIQTAKYKDVKIEIKDVKAEEKLQQSNEQTNDKEIKQIEEDLKNQSTPEFQEAKQLEEKLKKLSEPESKIEDEKSLSLEASLRERSCLKKMATTACNYFSSVGKGTYGIITTGALLFNTVPPNPFDLYFVVLGGLGGLAGAVCGSYIGYKDWQESKSEADTDKAYENSREKLKVSKKNCNELLDEVLAIFAKLSKSEHPEQKSTKSNSTHTPLINNEQKPNNITNTVSNTRVLSTTRVLSPTRLVGHINSATEKTSGITVGESNGSLFSKRTDAPKTNIPAKKYNAVPGSYNSHGIRRTPQGAS